jgi:cyanate lyase
MSMIDCKVNVEKKQDPKGDRVLLTFEYVSVPYFFPSIQGWCSFR